MILCFTLMVLKIFETGAAISAAIVIVRCNGRHKYYGLVLVYFGSQCTQFYMSGWIHWLFLSFYLELCMWCVAISQWVWEKYCEDAMHKMLCKSWEKCCGDIGNNLCKCSRKTAWATLGCLNSMLSSRLLTTMNT